jgi:GTP-binding protein EngB required for normal cell division
MDKRINEANGLVDWYRAHARPVLEELATDRVADFDAHANRLEKLGQLADVEIAACFLGQAAVGKSTLINALVAGGEVLLPAGGVGPLTAQAIELRYSEQPMFTVEYHGPQQFWQLVFALEQKLLKLSRSAEAVDSDLQSELKPDDDLPLLDDDQVVDHLERQGRLIVTGDQNQNVDLAYVVDCLRNAGGKPSKRGTLPNAEDEARIGNIKRVLQLASKRIPHTVDASLANGDFMRELRDHAAGFLAPLIRHIEVGWPSGILEGGLRLVDLPGVGISSDAYRTVTERWVRERAKAVCLVVNRAGIDAASAELLRTSGFLNRLLHSWDDPDADPVELIVAVTMLDSVATSEYQNERQTKPRSELRPKRQHLSDVRARVPGMIAAQLKTELSRISAEVEGPAKQASEAAVQRILEKLKVYPVTAHEFIRIMQDDEEERPFIEMPEESGIPAMQCALSSVVQARRADVFRRIAEASGSFRQQVNTTLKAIEARWLSPELETAESNELRRALQEFIPTRRDEFTSRKGAFREFLRQTVPEKIEGLVEQASASALEDMRRKSRSYRDIHWATLRAAVRRGGTFIGAKHVDLPRDFSLIYDGQVAPIWGQQVIKLVRERTRELGEDYVALIEEVVQWSGEQGARSQKRVLEALRDQVKADSRVLAGVGKDATDELRQRVREQLLKAVTQPIQRRCRKFVDDGEDRGRGVQQRILDLFDELVPEIVRVAKGPTLKVLNENYQDVEAEIRDQLKKNPDPLKTAEEAILEGHEEIERRSVAQKRKHALELLTAAFAAAQEPTLVTTVGGA